MREPACKISHLAIAASLALWMQAGFAAREEQIFEVTVSIPTADFYVLPVDSRFLEHEQIMSWDSSRETLKPLRALFDVRNVSGGITARLGHEPQIFNGEDLIGLSVKFNNQLLTLTDTVVVPETEAKTGARVPLAIEIIKPQDGFRPGEYYGSMIIIFEAQTPSG